MLNPPEPALSASIERPQTAALAANIAAAVGIALLGNGIVFALGWSGEAPDKIVPSFQPPGWAIGVVWTALFAAMGAARWAATRGGRAQSRRDARWVAGLILACFAYPYYTLGLRSAEIGLAGAVATMIFVAVIAWRLVPRSPLAAALILPTAAWCGFASLLLLRTLQLN